MKVITKSEKETKNFAKKIAQKLKPGDILALTGDLGGGKTTFTKGLARGLGIRKKITSPTFIIMRTYKIQDSSLRPELRPRGSKIQNFYHVDLYRIKGRRDIETIGLKEVLGDSKGIVVIEWAEKISQSLPKKAIWVTFDFVDENTRAIILKNY